MPDNPYSEPKTDFSALARETAAARDPDENWRSWCPITNSVCTAVIPVACLCAEMHPVLLDKLRRRPGPKPTDL